MENRLFKIPGIILCVIVLAACGSGSGGSNTGNESSPVVDEPPVTDNPPSMDEPPVVEEPPSAEEPAPVDQPPPSDEMTWPQLNQPLASDADLESRIDQLMDAMTLEEKIGQMIQPELRYVTPQDVRDYHLGSVLNGGGSWPNGNKSASVEDWLAKADGLYEASIDTSDGRLAIPIMWGTDAVHGHNNVMGATLFPHNIGLGATRNPDLIRDIGAVIAREMRVVGQDWDFSPTVAVARDDRWGRTYESFSEDPGILDAYAHAMITGLQGEPNTDAFLANGRVIATAKHFIADGGTQGGVDRGNANISEQELRDIHGPGYFSAIEAGVQVIMASFSSWQGEKLHGNQFLLTEVLKNQLGFDGVVLGDWNGHEFVNGCTQNSCPQAVNAGLDIFMVPNQWRELYANTLAQVRSGEIPQARIDDAVRRILRVKLRAGLFDLGSPSERAFGGDESLLGADEHRALARQAVRQSLVLLKNQDQLLPLDRNSRVLVAGDGAHDIGKQNGGWTLTWQGTGNENSDFPGATSVYEGIAQLVESAGGDVELSIGGEFEQTPDVAIVVFGEDPYAEGQGDRANLDYQPTSDLALLRQLQDQGIPTLSLFITGRPLWVNPEINASDAFVVIWHTGTEAGGVADVIFRDEQGQINHDFTGKLSFSWPRSAMQTPINRGDGQQPQFGYGFGLSYTDNGNLPQLSEASGLTGEDTSQELVLFDSRPMDPWRWIIGDATEQAKEVTSSNESLDTISFRTVDRQVQEDSVQLSWLLEEWARSALSAAERRDLSDYRQTGAALVMNLRLDEAPEGQVFIGMGCGQDCGVQVDITDALNTRPIGEWQEFSVDLACFHQDTMDLSMVLEPFSLTTAAPLTLSLHQLRLVSDAQAEIQCDN